ncbi:hypothetical protein CYMTET_44470 [Cymbomonas tetramitiformis]|uniref:Uncharacterized protein n=1 Tax=Cymbomonas tetramitiformis TaxID=36881 RepID=A0AAE0F0M8_9CHLO|nr:hypothetical protein CYMTET_44470 [Cymbomonas tetramitiformis]
MPRTPLGSRARVVHSSDVSFDNVQLLCESKSGHWEKCDSPRREQGYGSHQGQRNDLAAPSARDAGESSKEDPEVADTPASPVSRSLPEVVDAANDAAESPAPSIPREEAWALRWLPGLSWLVGTRDEAHEGALDEDQSSDSDGSEVSWAPIYTDDELEDVIYSDVKEFRDSDNGCDNDVAEGSENRVVENAYKLGCEEHRQSQERDAELCTADADSISPAVSNPTMCHGRLKPDRDTIVDEASKADLQPSALTIFPAYQPASPGSEDLVPPLKPKKSVCFAPTPPLTPIVASPDKRDDKEGREREEKEEEEPRNALHDRLFGQPSSVSTMPAQVQGLTPTSPLNEELQNFQEMLEKASKDGEQELLDEGVYESRVLTNSESDCAPRDAVVMNMNGLFDLADERGDPEASAPLPSTQAVEPQANGLQNCEDSWDFVPPAEAFVWNPSRRTRQGQDEGNTLPRRNTYAIHPFRDVAYKSRNEPNVIGRAAILHLQSVVKAAMVSSEVQEQATIQLEQLLQERSMLQAQMTGLERERDFLRQQVQMLTSRTEELSLKADESEEKLKEYAISYKKLELKADKYRSAYDQS